MFGAGRGGQKLIARSQPPGFRSPRSPVVVLQDAAQPLLAPNFADRGRIRSSMIPALDGRPEGEP